MNAEFEPGYRVSNSGRRSGRVTGQNFWPESNCVIVCNLQPNLATFPGKSVIKVASGSGKLGSVMRVQIV